MKLKLKAEARDWIIFVIYAVFLFFLICVAVVNLGTFATESRFSGFNPFLAFQRDYIGPTMVFYLGALIASFVSVQNHFFEREKGIGFSVRAKKEKGFLFEMFCALRYTLGKAGPAGRALPAKRARAKNGGAQHE